MFNRFNRRFAFQYQGGHDDWEGWTPPWLREERYGRGPHGPRFFGMRMGRRFFGPGGPFGPSGPFGPEGSEGRRFFGRGDLKYALLELLKERPMHGYEMMKALQERSHGFYVPSAGSIYPTLQMLEDRGLVTVNESEGKKVYSITDAGRAFLAERQPEDEDFANSPLERFFRQGRRWNEPEMQALRADVMEIARLFTIAGRMSINEPERLAQLRSILEHTRQELSDMIYGTGSKSDQSTTSTTNE